MKDLSGISAALRAVFQPIPGPLNPPRQSRSIGEAIDRLTQEAAHLTNEASRHSDFDSAMRRIVENMK